VTKLRLRLAACAALLFALGAPGGAFAGDLDQQQTTQNGARGIGAAQSAAQGFTAGRSGLLDQVDLDLQKLGSPPILTVEIRDLSGGVPGSQVLAGTAVQATSVATSLGFVPVRFPGPAQVVSGSQYSIVISSAGSGGNGYLWADKGPDAYPGGIEFLASPPGTWSAQSSFDFAFKTYVAPPVTAPAQSGQRAAALAKCKKKKSAKARRKCRKRAKKLPV
jgi:hypothetical protein